MRSIFIVDDHPMLRRGLTALIEYEPDLSVCGESGTVSETLNMVDEKQPHLLIVDLSLADGDGLDLVKAMKVKFPDIPTLVLSMHDEAVYAERSLRAGAKGYVSKQDVETELLLAVRAVLNGDTYMSNSLESRLAMKFVSGTSLATDAPAAALSDRELQVFGLIGRGFTTRKIASRLSLSVKTIESHLEHIKQKLNLDSAAALARIAALWIETGRIE